MNGVAKPVYTIQQTPKGEWRVTKGALSYLFPSEEAALKCMEIMVKGIIKNYDKDGKLI